jgi:hypothetical protein
VRTKIELHPFSSLCLAASIVDGDSDAAAMVLAIVQPNGRRVRHTNEARRRLSDRGELESMRATPWRGVTGVQVQPRLLDVQVHGVPLGSWKRPGLPVRPRARRIGAAGRRHLCGRSLEHAMSSSALGGRPAYRSPGQELDVQVRRGGSVREQLRVQAYLDPVCRFSSSPAYRGSSHGCKPGRGRLGA